MSDTNKSPENRMAMLAVSPDDFVRFINAKAEKDDICPVCSTDSWALLCSPDGEPVFRLGTPVRNREEQFYLSSFGYFCENCGFLRQHMAAIVHDWVQKNPDPSVEIVDSIGANEPGIND